MLQQVDPFAENNGTASTNPTEIGLWALIAEDFQTYDRDILAQGFWALFWHRIGNWRMGIKSRLLRSPFTLLYRLMAKACEWFGGIYLPYTVHVGRRVKLEHFGGMILVAHTIGDDVIIRQNTTFGISSLNDQKGRPIIEDGVELGAGAVVLGRVRIGKNAVIGANSAVVSDIPSNAVAAGAPAKVLKVRGAIS